MPSLPPAFKELRRTWDLSAVRFLFLLVLFDVLLTSSTLCSSIQYVYFTPLRRLRASSYLSVLEEATMLLPSTSTDLFLRSSVPLLQILGQVPSNAILAKSRPSYYISICVFVWVGSLFPFLRCVLFPISATSADFPSAGYRLDVHRLRPQLPPTHRHSYPSRFHRFVVLPSLSFSSCRPSDSEITRRVSLLSRRPLPPLYVVQEGRTCVVRCVQSKIRR